MVKQNGETIAPAIFDPVVYYRASVGITGAAKSMPGEVLERLSADLQLLTDQGLLLALRSPDLTLPPATMLPMWMSLQSLIATGNWR